MSIINFPSSHVCSGSCGINDPDGPRVVITGGLVGRTDVTIYNTNGHAGDLPPLITGRQWHACSSYTAESGTRVSFFMDRDKIMEQIITS